MVKGIPNSPYLSSHSDNGRDNPSHQPSVQLDASNALILAARAQSLRGTFLRYRRIGDPVTYGDLADLAELVQLLATDVDSRTKPSE